MCHWLRVLLMIAACVPIGVPAATPVTPGCEGLSAPGADRLELYPLRGVSTERQYPVYFPQYHLLYGSDTLVINPDQTRYDPQLMHEVRQAVEREHLAVDTVYAMHQGPTPWKEVLTLLAASA